MRVGKIQKQQIRTHSNSHTLPTHTHTRAQRGGERSQAPARRRRIGRRRRLQRPVRAYVCARVWVYW